MGRLSRLSTWALNIMCPYKREAEGNLITDEEEGEMKMTAETGVIAASRGKEQGLSWSL